MMRIAMVAATAGVLLTGTARAEEPVVAAPVAPAAPAVPLPAAPTAQAIPPAQPEARPSGLGWILGGTAAGAVGLLNLGTAPVCYSSRWVEPKSAGLCAGLSVGVGVALLGAAVPMLVHGGKQRAAFLAPTVEPVKSGAVMSWGGRF